MDSKILSYSCLAVGLLFYLIALYVRATGRTTHNMGESTRDGFAKVLIMLSALSVSISTVVGATAKTVDLKGAINIIIVFLAIVIVLLGAWKHWGLLVLSLAMLISILASAELVVE